MPAKLDVFNLGASGLNLVDSPVHAEDGSLTLAQNAVVNIVDGEPGVAKRPGMAKLSTTASGSSLVAVLVVNLTDPSP